MFLRLSLKYITLVPKTLILCLALQTGIASSTEHMLGKLKGKTISRPASPKAGSAAASTGARLIGASRALYIPVVGREIQKYLDKGYLVNLIPSSRFMSLRSSPNAGKTSSENSKGEQSPSSPVHTGVLQNRYE